MKTLPQRALKVFAVLESYRDGSPDILESLMPFFEPLFSSLGNGYFNPESFASQVRETYRWNFTSDIVEELAPRFVRHGWIAEERKTKNEIVYKITYTDSNDAGSLKHDILKKIDEISSTFQRFILDISPITTYNLERDRLADMLIEWLVQIDAYTEDVLKANAVGDSKGSTLSIEYEAQDASSLTSEEKYLCARFVRHLMDTQSEHSKFLCDIASIGLITEVVKDFKKPITHVDRSSLIVYLDAPVALNLLGVSGTAGANNIRPLVAQIIEMGGSIRIYRNSVHELQQALEATLRRAPSDRVGPTADAIRRNEVHEAYVREVARSPDEFLNKRNVQVVERTLDQFPGEHEFFTDEDYEAMFAAMTWHLEVPRREHDAMVIALVTRMRRGLQTSDIFEAKHLLVTRNVLLAQSARRLCVSRGLLRKSSIQPAVHQRQLAMAIWLRTGLTEVDKNDIPRRYLLAACERVLQLRKNVVDQVRRMSSTLTEDQAAQLDLLLTQDRSRQMLMDKTLGVSNVISDRNIEQLVEFMRGSLIEEIEKEKQQEVKKIRSEERARTKEAQKAATEAEGRVIGLEATIDAGRQEDLAVVERLVAEINLAARRRRTIGNWLLGAGVALAGVFPLVAGLLSGLWGVLTLVASAIIGLVLAYFQLFNRTLNVSGVVEKWAVKRLSILALRRGLVGKCEKFTVITSDGQLRMRDENKDSSSLI